jgi:hypothetical protein
VIEHPDSGRGEVVSAYLIVGFLGEPGASVPDIVRPGFRELWLVCPRDINGDLPGLNPQVTRPTVKLGKELDDMLLHLGELGAHSVDSVRCARRLMLAVHVGQVPRHYGIGCR